MSGSEILDNLLVSHAVPSGHYELALVKTISRMRRRKKHFTQTQVLTGRPRIRWSTRYTAAEDAVSHAGAASSTTSSDEFASFPSSLFAPLRAVLSCLRYSSKPNKGSCTVQGENHMSRGTSNKVDSVVWSIINISSPWMKPSIQAAELGRPQRVQSFFLARISVKVNRLKTHLFEFWFFKEWRPEQFDTVTL